MPKLSPEEIKSVVKINYGAYFGFAVTASSARSQTYLNSDSVKKINQVISDIIHEEMYRMITRQAGKFVQVDQTIREFTAMYDFTEDELPFENLKRWYYRERKERELRRQKLEASGPQFILTLTEERKSDECIVRKMAS